MISNYIICYLYQRDLSFKVDLMVLLQIWILHCHSASVFFKEGVYTTIKSMKGTIFVGDITAKITRNINLILLPLFNK